MIYFDNASTTKPAEEVTEAVCSCMENTFGNPSSLHILGVRAEQVMTDSRKALANALDTDENCIYFTSGATESSNLAVRGAAGAYGKRKKRVITTTVEHSSVKEAFNRLESEGFEVIRIAPGKDGAFHEEDFADAADENTCLISTMLVNNETGAVLPVEKIFSAVRKKNREIVTHCDAVQAFMKLPVRPDILKADLISMSAHKIYGPKGVGALYVRKGIRLTKQNLGGKQERDMRGGTEAVPLIAGFGKAVSLLEGNMKERTDSIKEINDFLRQKLSQTDGIYINSPDDGVPYILNFSAKGIRSEIMLHYLESREIYVSSGSACSKGAKSGVLGQFGLSRELEDSAVRLSFSHKNTVSEAEQFMEALNDAVKKIKRK